MKIRRETQAPLSQAWKATCPLSLCQHLQPLGSTCTGRQWTTVKGKTRRSDYRPLNSQHVYRFFFFISQFALISTSCWDCISQEDGQCEKEDIVISPSVCVPGCYDVIFHFIDFQECLYCHCGYCPCFSRNNKTPCLLALWLHKQTYPLRRCENGGINCQESPLCSNTVRELQCDGLLFLDVHSYMCFAVLDLQHTVSGECEQLLLTNQQMFLDLMWTQRD